MARKHLINGCGAAALSALETIRSITQEDQIVLVAKEDCPPYSPSSLPQLLSGRLEEEALWVRPQGYFQDMGATLATGKEVVQVLPAGKEVAYLDGQRERYDTLLIATGSEPLWPGIRGLAETGCLGFRTLQDCRALAARLGAKSRAAVLGGAWSAWRWPWPCWRGATRWISWKGSPGSCRSISTCWRGGWWGRSFERRGAGFMPAKKP